jgi:hypothetical protein
VSGQTHLVNTFLLLVKRYAWWLTYYPVLGKHLVVLLVNTYSCW